MTTFHTPAQWGSRGAQRPLTAYTAADVLGLGLHWEGSGAPPDDHDDCAQRVRDDEAYHLDVAEPPNHYAALAYSSMYCNHGTVFVGPRGLEYRTGANGDATVNATYLAACWIGGPGHAPTPAAKRAARDFRGLVLMRYPRALAVKPHRWLVSGGTECPGPDLIAYATELDGTPDDGPDPIPNPQEDDMVTSVLYRGRGKYHPINEHGGGALPAPSPVKADPYVHVWANVTNLGKPTSVEARSKSKDGKAQIDTKSLGSLPFLGTVTLDLATMKREPGALIEIDGAAADADLLVTVTGSPLA